MKARLLSTALLCSFLVGCGREPIAEFSLSTATQDLMPGAQAAVSDNLEDLFGDPQDLVAWSRLPVNYGGFTGTIAEPPEGVEVDAKTRVIRVDFPEDVPDIEEPVELLWLDGGELGNSWLVDSYDSETGLLHLSEDFSGDAAGELPNYPKPGPSFVLDPGREMKHGRQLYMTHCMHCHGVAGDGAGPTAEYLNPRPRDYRQGKFKFTSTKPQVKACRDDLARVIRYGIAGTYMPSFLLLEDDELESIVEYVRWLAMRGELERIMSISLLSDFKDPRKVPAAAADRAATGQSDEEVETALVEYLNDPDGFMAELDEESDILSQSWQEAQEETSQIVPSVARPDLTRASVTKGKELYLGDKLKCWNCHGISGQGNGPETLAYKKNDSTGELYGIPGLHDDWGNPLKPRNLTRGVYRGGRRPIDLFRRIRAGVKGAVMPAHTEALATDEEVWHVVNYVLSIPLSTDDIPEASSPVEDEDSVAAAEQ